MHPTVKAQPCGSQGNSLARELPVEDKELALFREDLKWAVEESREKKEYVAAAMGLSGPEYLSKLFSGEKTITARHIVGLPQKVEALFEARRAERLGHVVVEHVDEQTARRHLLSGLLGLLAPKRLARAACARVRPARRRSEVA